MNKENLNNIFQFTPCLQEQELLDYVNNRLSNSERNKVEHHALNCKFCTDAIEGFEAFNNIEHYSENKNAVLKKDKKVKRLWPYISVAASILIVFTIVQLLEPADNQINQDIVAENKGKITTKEESEMQYKVPLTSKEDDNTPPPKADAAPQKTVEIKKVETTKKTLLKENAVVITADKELRKESNFATSDAENTELDENTNDLIAVSEKNELKNSATRSKEQESVAFSDENKSDFMISESKQKMTFSTTDANQTSLLEKALQFKKQNQLDSAATIILRIKKGSVNYNESRYELGIIYLLQKDTTNAINVLKEIEKESILKSKSDSILNKLN